MTKLFNNNILLMLTMLLAGLLPASAGLTAQVLKFGNEPPQIVIDKSTYQQLTLSNTIDQIETFDVKSLSTDYVQLRAEGYGYSTHVGTPMLPVLKKLIEIPLGCTISIEIIKSEYLDVNLADYGIDSQIIPVQPPVSKSDNPELAPFARSESAYSTDGFGSDDLVTVVPLGIMRGVRLARLEIAPVQYNPVKGIVRVYRQMNINIVYTNANLQATLQMKTKNDNQYFKSVTGGVFNSEGLSDGLLTTNQPVTYIIISDPLFADALQPFIEWKTRKGFKVVEAYTDDPLVGNTTASIRQYLRDFYDNPPSGFSPQTFILLVGDVAQVPAFSGTTGGHVTDLYYAEYTDDIFPDAFYGRFSANNLAELQPQIDKTLEYEQYLFPDPTFLDEAVLIAGADASYASVWGNGQVNYGTSNYFNETHGLQTHTYLQPEPAGGNYSALIIQNISQGVSYVNYTAHCSTSGWSNPGFVTGSVSGLTNAHKYPLMVGNCCSSSAFQANCLAEAVLRAPLKGAVGYIGASNNTYWDEDFWWSVGFEAISTNPAFNPAHLGAFDRTFHDQPGITHDDWYITQGQMPVAGNLAVTQAGAQLEKYYWEIYHLMGDPSLMVYFSQPPTITADYASLITPGQPSFVVNTAPYAFVAISTEGILNGAALADSDGLAEVFFDDPIVLPGEADIVITGQNLQPYSAIISVAAPDAPYVLLADFGVNDLQSNGNGLAEYGETFGLDVSMKNFGLQPASNVTLTLSTVDEFVLINNANATLGNLNPNSTVALEDIFDIHFSANIPDGHQVAFVLQATDGTEQWKSNFSIKGHAPHLYFGGFSIDDSQGNNNGRFDTGETVSITTLIKNNGSAAAPSVMGQLTTDNAYLTVKTTDYLPFGDIGVDGQAMATYEVAADENTPTGLVATLLLDFKDALAGNAISEFPIVVGQVPVLIVDLDKNHNSADKIAEAIQTLNISAATETTLPDDLVKYASIMVCLGIYPENRALTADEGQKLYDYLMAGGKLYLEGGDAWYYDATTAVRPLFAINGVSDGHSDLSTVEGVNGTMTQGLSMQYTGDNNWIDRLRPVDEGFVILKNINPAYSCAIANDGGTYKTIGTSAEFGGFGNNRVSLMKDYLEFFGIITNNSLSGNISAAPAELCAGETTQLNVSVYGGSGNYYYNWVPAESLSNPALRNPVATPLTNTLYVVTVTDLLKGQVYTSEIQIEVHAMPVAPVITQVGENLVSSAQFGNQWYNDEGAMQGAVGQSYHPTIAGNYYSVITNVWGCESIASNSIFFQPTFIAELERQGNFRIFPNPAIDKVNIDFLAENDSKLDITILNAYGQNLYQVTLEDLDRSGINSFAIDLSLFDGGVYYIIMKNANKIVTRKLILGR